MYFQEFAFDGNPQNPHLPRNYVANTVAYTATHDNSTTRGWFATPPEQQKQALPPGLRPTPAKAAVELMRLAWSSSAALAIAPLQDVLNLGASARMNTPGQPSGNWRWRVTDDLLSPAAFNWLLTLTSETNRRPTDLAAIPSTKPRLAEVTI